MNIAERVKQEKFIPAVVAFALNSNSILLGRRQKVSNSLGQNLISGIGGKIDAGETAEQALQREVYEEVGLILKDYNLVGRLRFIFNNKPKWQMDVQVYIVHEWTGKPSESTEMKPIWYPLDAVPYTETWDDYQYWLPRVLAGEVIDEVYLYDKDNQHIEERLVLK